MRLLILVHPVLHPALETSELLLVRTSSVYDIQVVPLELLKLSNNVQTYHDNWPVWKKKKNLCGPPQLTKLMHFISLASSLCVKKLHLPEQRLNQQRKQAIAARWTFCNHTSNKVTLKHLPPDKTVTSPDKLFHIHLITPLCLHQRFKRGQVNVLLLLHQVLTHGSGCDDIAAVPVRLLPPPLLPSPPCLPFAPGRSSLRSCGGTVRSLLLGNCCLKIFPVEFWR